MNDIKQRDKELFLKELFSFGRLFLVGSLLFLVIINQTRGPWLLLLLAVAGVCAMTAYTRSVEKRFKNRRFLLLWAACKDRLKRFNKAFSDSTKDGVVELQELPKTIVDVGSNLYVALRRADIIIDEVSASEGWLVPPKGQAGPISPDQRTQELYLLADKNIAEYRQNYQGVIARVERTEAQAAVFTTTLDTLRMRMLGHRLSSSSPELDHGDFLQAMAEARLQLDSIDKALEELDETPYPKFDGIDTVAVPTVEQPPTADETTDPGSPPPIPDDAKRQINEERND